MASEITFLIPEFRKLFLAAIEATKAQGVMIAPMLTLVTPLEQGAVWRQGKTIADAELKALALDNANAPYLANMIRMAKPQETNNVTDQVPGLSWHQWGEAVTVVWVDNQNKLNYSPTHIERPANRNGYVMFREQAEKLGLHMPRYCEVQFRPEPSPLDVYSYAEINNEMQKRFGRVL